MASENLGPTSGIGQAFLVIPPLTLNSEALERVTYT